MSDPTTVTAARRDLGKRLAALREAAGYSQAGLGRRLSYARSTVANVESGRHTVCADFWAAADDTTTAGGQLLAEARRVEAMCAAERRDARAAARRARAGDAAPLNGTVQPTAPVEQEDADAAEAIHQVLATVAEHSGDSAPDRSTADLEHRILDAYRHSHAGHRTLTLVGGYAGSGKSEFGRFLCAMTGWCLLDKDTLSRPLVEQLLAASGADPNDRHTAAYLEKVRPYEYRGLLDAGLENLRAGISTVLTAPFVHELSDTAWIARVRNRCTALGADLVVIWVHCDEDSMHDYISYRGAARDAWKLTNWDEYFAGVDPQFEPAAPHYTVDNRLNAALALTDQARDIALAVRPVRAGART